MADGTVTATSLNIRDAPGGNVIGLLLRDTPISVLDQKDIWLRISASVEGQTRLGWVSADWVSLGSAGAPAAASPAPIPPPDDPAHPVTVQGNKAIGPDGKSFATVKNDGFYTLGRTPLADWLRGNPPPAGLAPSAVRVVRAVSLNEGNLEAVNSYDNAFLSFGMLQWTAGADSAAGELAGLLDLVRRSGGNAFQTYFGAYDLGFVLSPPSANWAPTGYLTIDGTTLRSPDDKEQLRGAEWAYRFWRAGHDQVVRLCQLQLVAARIDLFSQRHVAGFTVADWLTSEYGVALVLDEHVNRPGHVPDTLGKAIAKLPPNPGPTGWSDAEEGRLIQLYIEERDATNMTNPAQRAAQIADCVHDGTLSDGRGSFVTPAAATGA
jgi:Bacterial SH3 domain